MTTVIPDRSAVRAELAALLTVGLTGTGHLVQAVYAYSPKDFGGKSPVVALGSAGANRQRLSARGSRASYLIDLWVFVLYASVAEDGTLKLGTGGQPIWDERNSQDALDRIEAEIAELLDGNQVHGQVWKAVDYNAPSTAEVMPVGDQAYRAELIPLRFETF